MHADLLVVVPEEEYRAGRFDDRHPDCLSGLSHDRLAFGTASARTVALRPERDRRCHCGSSSWGGRTPGVPRFQETMCTACVPRWSAKGCETSGNGRKLLLKPLGTETSPGHRRHPDLSHRARYEPCSSSGSSIRNRIRLSSDRLLRLVRCLSLQRPPPIRECTCMSCHPSGCSSALRNVPSGSKPAFEATRHDATLAIECRISSR